MIRADACPDGRRGQRADALLCCVGLERSQLTQPSMASQRHFTVRSYWEIGGVSFRDSDRLVSRANSATQPTVPGAIAGDGSGKGST